MNLVSMKLEHKPDEAKPSEVLYPSPDKPEYPWGLQLHLEEDQLKKLSVVDMPEVGSEMMITAKVRVSSVNSHATEKGENRGMQLQITELSLGSK